MATIQTSFQETIDAAAAGVLAGMEPHEIVSRLVENSNGIPFGRAVGFGTNENQCRLGAAADTSFLGISVKDATLDPRAVDSEYVDEYKQYDNCGILVRGTIWVVTGGVVSPGNDVTFAATTGILSTAGTSGTQFAIPGAKWISAAANGGLAKVHLSGYLKS